MTTSFILILLAIFVYGLIHSILASLKVKALSRRWFGPASERVYRVVYNLFAALSFLPVLALAGILPDQLIYRIPFPWSLLTLALQILAILMLGMGLLQTDVWYFLGVRQLLQPGASELTELVISGLYRRVRHPLYTAGLVVYLVRAADDAQPAGHKPWSDSLYPGRSHVRRTQVVLPVRSGLYRVQETHADVDPSPG